MFSHNFKVGGELHNFNEGLVIYLLSLYFVMEEDWHYSTGRWKDLYLWDSKFVKSFIRLLTK